MLDALRGLALLGILLANINDWSGWGSLRDPQKFALAGQAIARAYDFLVAALIEGKFYTIFSFLFGLGFSLQLARLERRGADGVAIYRRRLLILLMFGLAHMLLIWEGDILTLYALLGMLLPFARGWSDRRLIATAIVLILLPIPGFALVHAANGDPDAGLIEVGERLFTALGGDNAQAVMWRTREDWSSYFSFVLSGPPFRIGGFFESWRIPKVMGIMLIGLWTGRRLVAGTLLEDRAMLKRIATAGLLIGVPVNLIYATMGGLEQDGFGAGLTTTTLYAIGVVPLGLSYAACFALLWPKAKVFLGLLAAPGRMALTNYLLHSLLGVAIFYGIGFGLMAKLPPPGFIAIAFGIFSAQLVLSRWWLSHHAQGPMEALWRRLTYGTRENRPTVAG